ncbi:ATP-binding protein [Actinokineospora iranica]|uniref:Predicted ATPase n=1 Tax=Actinokineospora iranica TaxID=1271860 RepID=A0A1G6T2M5_9PSEU|nr:LuxR C-terminal-related transcriptional regulator [Actinokineospora iranica]SDD22635.1 Predicted ATPase [Actinokineospora iranica]
MAGPPIEMTSYVGRQSEGADVRRLLSENRLVTLTGPGGVGKTRLATHVAQELAGAFRDGVVFVGLAEVRDPALLTTVLADRLGLLDQYNRHVTRMVVDYLRTRRTLLVLDNCEHLVDACAELLDEVLAECGGVVVLATSRQSIGVSGEQVLAVPPLAVPDEATPLEDLARYDSVRLFLDRAVAVSPAFAHTAENNTDLVRLCRQLDGLPLAIELAARRTRSLSPRQIAERLTQRLSLLTTGTRLPVERQQTLRATIDWSHELCSPAEQAVWARASVFAGSFDLDAAEEVCAGGGDPSDVDHSTADRNDVLDLVDGLLDKSVLIREEHDGRDDVVRYRMLEALREYGHEKLVESGDADRVARLHRDWFDRLTESADRQWLGPGQPTWGNRLRRDHANLRAALEWSISTPGEAAAALRMASRVPEYWALRGLNTEALRWVDRALAATPPDHPDRAFALSVSAYYALGQFNVAVADARLAEAAALADRTGDDLVRARITFVRGYGALLSGDYAAAADLNAAAAAAFRARDDVRRELHPLFLQALATAVLGRLAEAREVIGRAVTLTDGRGEGYYRSMALNGRACVEGLFGDPDIGLAAGREGVRADELTGSRQGRAHNIETLAWIAQRQGDNVRAATLFGAAQTLWEAVMTSPEHTVSMAVPHFRLMGKARDALGATRFDRAFAAGRAMSDAEVVRYALGEAEVPETTGMPEPRQAEGAGKKHGPLSVRESEIAELVADGLTNQEIADKLVIARRTAETHVANILAKLDAGNRAQIATWVTARRDARLG